MTYPTDKKTTSHSSLDYNTEYIMELQGQVDTWREKEREQAIEKGKLEVEVKQLRERLQHETNTVKWFKEYITKNIHGTNTTLISGTPLGSPAAEDEEAATTTKEAEKKPVKQKRKASNTTATTANTPTKTSSNTSSSTSSRVQPARSRNPPVNRLA